MRLKTIVALLSAAFSPRYVAPQTGRMTGVGSGNVPSELPVTSLNAGRALLTANTTLDETYAGKALVLDAAAGCTITLPRATGSGAEYKFFVKTTVTSNSYIIKAGNAQDSFVGTEWVTQDGGNTALMFEVQANDDTITMNGGTQGGYSGDRISIVDMESGLFNVIIWKQATSSEATSTSATVS